MNQKQTLSLTGLAIEAEIINNELQNTSALLLTIATALEVGAEESRALCACSYLVESIHDKTSLLARELYNTSRKPKASDILGARAASED